MKKNGRDFQFRKNRFSIKRKKRFETILHRQQLIDLDDAKYTETFGYQKCQIKSGKND